jgi:hypothetical protein
LIICRNVHHENPFGWNEIDVEVENGIEGHMDVGLVENMYVNEGQHFGVGGHGYVGIDELNDGKYNDIDHDHSKKMEMKEATTVIATIIEKVVLVALWSKIIVMLLTLAMVMADLVMLAMNPCITTWNQTKKVVTKKWSFKIVYF